MHWNMVSEAAKAEKTVKTEKTAAKKPAEAKASDVKATDAKASEVKAAANENAKSSAEAAPKKRGRKPKTDKSAE